MGASSLNTMPNIKAFGYYGGKFSKLPFILPQLVTPHKTFVEVCGGSAAVLLNKPRAKKEVLNDLASEVTTFWRVIRDEPDELIRKIKCTPPGESEYRRIPTLPPSDNDIETARRFYVRIMHTFSYVPPRASSSYGYSYLKTDSFVANRRGLEVVAERMRDVVVENTVAVKLVLRLINALNAAKSGKPILFYIDPPYTLDSRRDANVYIHDDFDHTALLETITTAPSWCKFAVSGYENELYNTALADWHRVEFECVTTASQVGSTPRTEILWRNYEPVTGKLF